MIFLFLLTRSFHGIFCCFEILILLEVPKFKENVLICVITVIKVRDLLLTLSQANNFDVLFVANILFREYAGTTAMFQFWEIESYYFQEIEMSHFRNIEILQFSGYYNTSVFWRLKSVFSGGQTYHFRGIKMFFFGGLNMSFSGN